MSSACPSVGDCPRQAQTRLPRALLLLFLLFLLPDVRLFDSIPPETPIELKDTPVTHPMQCRWHGRTAPRHQTSCVNQEVGAVLLLYRWRWRIFVPDS
eukprot:4873101-Amphidinium_carterae.1